MKCVLLSLLFFASITVFAQQGAQAIQPDPSTETAQRVKTIFTKPIPGQTVTLKIKTGDYDKNKVGAFKDALIGFEGKISSVNYDEHLNELTLTYNDKTGFSELTGIFEKYGINYYRDPAGTINSSNETK